jgi:hypothetical protein
VDVDKLGGHRASPSIAHRRRPMIRSAQTAASSAPTRRKSRSSREGARESRTATGDSSRPFMEGTDDPKASPAFGSAARRCTRKSFARSGKQPQEPPPASDDPAGEVRRQQLRPAPAPSPKATHFATTDEGHIADVNGKPVAFRNIKDAARFAAKNKLGGDFEPVVWATNSARVVLTQAARLDLWRTPPPDGPQEPPAGRSADDVAAADPRMAEGTAG